jgi:hypothetical protein
MSEHPSRDLLERYARNGLRGEELLSLDDHLAGCPECRAHLAPSPARAARAWQSSLAAEHLAYAQIEAYADDALTAQERQDVDAQAASCRPCADELTDLRLFRGRNHRPPAAWWIAVAATVITVSTSVLLWPRRQPPRGTDVVATATVPPVRPPEPELHVLRDAKTTFVLAADGSVQGLRPRDADTVRQLRAGVVAGAAIFAEVGGGGDTLRGEETSRSGLVIEQPRGFVLDDRPELRWSDRESDAVYVVAVFDHASRAVAGSGELTTKSWRPDRPLRRNETYDWQVTRRRGDEVTSAPSPPAAPARFRVVSAPGMEEIRSARAAKSHFLAALAYAREGMIGEALREIDRLGLRNPDSLLIHELRIALERAARADHHHPLPINTNADQ